MTSQSQISQMTAFYGVFEFSSNRFRLNMEPHELVWKSVTANLHRISVSIFKVFSKSEIYGTIFSDFLYFRPLNCQKDVLLGLVEVHLLTCLLSTPFDLGPI